MTADDSRDRAVMPTEDRVIAMIAEGVPEGMELLYDRYGRLAFSLAHRVLNDAAAAEDVVQDSLLSIWRRASTYRPERGSVRTWVCSIVHHRALDRLRGRSGRALTDLPLENARATSGVSDTWEMAAAAIERGRVRAALEALPADQRRVLELAYFGGFSQVEISDLTRSPLGTVKGRTRLGLRRLRSILEAEGIEGAMA